jgi:hypothetical protein
LLQLPSRELPPRKIVHGEQMTLNRALTSPEEGQPLPVRHLGVALVGALVEHPELGCAGGKAVVPAAAHQRVPGREAPWVVADQRPVCVLNAEVVVVTLGRERRVAQDRLEQRVRQEVAPDAGVCARGLGERAVGVRVVQIALPDEHVGRLLCEVLEDRTELRAAGSDGDAHCASGPRGHTEAAYGPEGDPATPFETRAPVDAPAGFEAADDLGRGPEAVGPAELDPACVWEAPRVRQLDRRASREVRCDVQLRSTPDRWSRGGRDDGGRTPPGRAGGADRDLAERRRRSPAYFRDDRVSGRSREERLSFLDPPRQQVEVAERRQDRIRVAREERLGGCQHAGVAAALERGKVVVRFEGEGAPGGIDD